MMLKTIFVCMIMALLGFSFIGMYVTYVFLMLGSN